MTKAQHLKVFKISVGITIFYFAFTYLISKYETYHPNPEIIDILEDTWLIIEVFGTNWFSAGLLLIGHIIVMSIILYLILAITMTVISFIRKIYRYATKIMIIGMLMLLLPALGLGQNKLLDLDTCKSIRDLNTEEIDEFVKFQKGEEFDIWKLKLICNCVYVTYYAASKKIYERGERRDCEKHGEWVVYGKNSEIRRVVHYNYGKRHGEFIAYWGNGQIAIHGTYYNDNYHGEVNCYDFQGNLVERANYENGKILSNEVLREWEPDGVIQYEWPNLPKPFRKKEKSGVYIWKDGELVFLRNFEKSEIESGVPILELNEKAKKKD